MLQRPLLGTDFIINALFAGVVGARLRVHRWVQSTDTNQVKAGKSGRKRQNLPAVRFLRTALSCGAGPGPSAGLWQCLSGSEPSDVPLDAAAAELFPFIAELAEGNSSSSSSSTSLSDSRLQRRDTGHGGVLQEGELQKNTHSFHPAMHDVILATFAQVDQVRILLDKLSRHVEDVQKGHVVILSNPNQEESEC